MAIYFRGLKFDDYAITMNIGFTCYGLLGLINLLKLGYHKEFSLRLLKVCIQPLIVILAVINIFRTGTFLFILMPILSDRLILSLGIVESQKGSK